VAQSFARLIPLRSSRDSSSRQGEPKFSDPRGGLRLSALSILQGVTVRNRRVKGQLNYLRPDTSSCSEALNPTPDGSMDVFDSMRRAAFLPGCRVRRTRTLWVVPPSRRVCRGYSRAAAGATCFVQPDRASGRRGRSCRGADSFRVEYFSDGRLERFRAGVRSSVAPTRPKARSSLSMLSPTRASGPQMRTSTARSPHAAETGP